MEQLSPNAKALLDAGGIGWAFHPDQNMDVLVERNTGRVIDPAGGIYTPRSPQIHHEREDRVDVAKFRFHVRKYEDYIQYMYLDKKGYVTVGFGHRFNNVDEAKKLTFWKRELVASEGTRVRAGVADVNTAFNAVKNSGLVNHMASAFHTLKGNEIDLDINEIERLFIGDVREFVRQLHTESDFSDFYTYPAPVQLGMLDLLYTIGYKGFFGTKEIPGFDDLSKALKYRNWIEAAEQSHRLEVEDQKGEPNETMKDRNKIVGEWFLEAIEEEPFFVNPKCPKKNI